MIRAAIAPVVAIQRARDGVRRAAVRRRLESVASGKTADASFNFDELGVDMAGVLEELTVGLQPDSIRIERLVATLKNSGTVDRLVERLETKGVHHRAASARAIGALRMYEAVPSVAPLLASRERPVADAAARALGRIGGTRSATALLLAIQRRGLNRRLVAELARSAPDLFLEVAMSERQKPGVRPALALAAGLRRRRTATSQLMILVQRGSRRERVISCRALGWIGAAIAIPVITEALLDRDWKLRMSAAKALGMLRAQESSYELRCLSADRNPRVRKAAQNALRQIDAISEQGGGAGGS
ncbi:MAG: HEAT repeat domain-containing protein [Chloroflexi bacterium]|nr:MAG: HEAT repeat domain-containing protein [Chloroflexota bacterium]TMF34348.1 MAG: HEAT repeat domain-containing protein [Chloroflexota bacterium]